MVRRAGRRQLREAENAAWLDSGSGSTSVLPDSEQGSVISKRPETTGNTSRTAASRPFRAIIRDVYRVSLNVIQFYIRPTNDRCPSANMQIADFPGFSQLCNNKRLRKVLMAAIPSCDDASPRVCHAGRYCQSPLTDSIGSCFL